MIPPILLLLALFGAPLFAIIAAGAMFSFGWDELYSLPLGIYQVVSIEGLVAIPLFTFAGYMLGETGAPKRLVNLTQAAFGWLPGGLPIVTLVVCAFFTAFTGASGVTIIALGSLLYPALLQGKYEDKFSLGMVTSSGSLGILFAPAIPLILYGIIASSQPGVTVGIDKLFAAGLAPGILMILVLSGYSIFIAMRMKKRGVTTTHEFSWPELGKALRATAWEIPLPFVVLGGIYSGTFALSDASAITAFYVLVVEVLIYREVPLKKLPSVMRRSMALVGGILIIIAMSIASTNYMIEQQVPRQLFEMVNVYISSKWTFLIVLNIFLLALGCILDIFSAIVLIVPLLIPFAVNYGIDPLHLGIIFLANMQIGYSTPPVGMNLFIASYRFDKPILTIYLATLPFIVLLLAVVLIITYWPDLSLFLPQFIK